MAEIKRVLKLENYEVELDCTVKFTIAAPKDIIEDFLLQLLLFNGGRAKKGENIGVSLKQIGDHYLLCCDEKGICVEGVIDRIRHTKEECIDTLDMLLAASSQTWKECKLFFDELMLAFEKVTNKRCICTLDEGSYRETPKSYSELVSVRNDTISNVWLDDKGVMYSANKKRLLKAPEGLRGKYTVLPGTEVICNHAFHHAENLTGVNLPEGLKAIGSAFWGCGSLRSITLPDSVCWIGACAFEGCERLKSVSISKNLHNIGARAFCDCSSLKTVNILDELTVIGEDAFKNCPGNPFARVDDKGVLYSKNKKRLLKAEKKLDGSYSILPGTKVICAEAFAEQENLQSVTIPDTVVKIGCYAFRGCSSLKSVTIPDSVQEIEEEAFSSCDSLRSVTLPKCLDEISNGLFQHCTALKSITIPATVTSIGEYAFFGCEALKSISLLGNPVIGKDAFKNCP